MKTSICWLIVLALAGCSGGSVIKEPAPISGPHEQQTEHIRTLNFDDSENNPAQTDVNEMMMDVPIIAQNPELKYGCEVTSLAMLLQYSGIEVDKMQLVDQLPKDQDPVVKSESGDITHWGNPNHGFVGDITGKRMGYAIYAAPLEQLMNRYIPGRTVNLTDKPFEEILKQLRDRKPVVVWTTGDYKLPDRWESWSHGNEEIRTPLDLHAVVLVGFDSSHFYVNDPLSGKKAHPVDKQSFMDTWAALGKQALSYR